MVLLWTVVHLPVTGTTTFDDYANEVFVLYIMRQLETSMRVYGTDTGWHKKVVITKIQITSEVLFKSIHGISKLKFGGLLEQKIILGRSEKEKDRFVMSAVIQV